MDAGMIVQVFDYGRAEYRLSTTDYTVEPNGRIGMDFPFSILLAIDEPFAGACRFFNFAAGYVMIDSWIWR